MQNSRLLHRRHSCRLRLIFAGEWPPDGRQIIREPCEQCRGRRRACNLRDDEGRRVGGPDASEGVGQRLVGSLLLGNRWPNGGRADLPVCEAFALRAEPGLRNGRLPLTGRSAG
jgi:hypothetical protein